MIRQHLLMPEQRSSFWQRLVESSKERGLDSSPSAIAAELDIWPSAVTKWVAGTGLPTKKHLVTLALHRGIHTEWLLTGQGDKYVIESDPLSKDMFTLWSQLKEQPRRRLVAAARYELAAQAAAAAEVAAQVTKLLA